MKGLLKFLYFKYRHKAIVHSKTVSWSSKIGEKTRIRPNGLIRDCEIEDHVYVNTNAQIYESNIGRYSSIGPSAIIGANEHLTDKIFTNNDLVSITSNKALFKRNNRRTIIEADVWIGAKSIISKGVTIGTGAIIGAGAIVTKDVPPYTIWIGVPAKLLRNRLPKESVDILLQSKWWKADSQNINNALKCIDVSTTVPEQIRQFVSYLNGRKDENQYTSNTSKYLS